MEQLTAEQQARAIKITAAAIISGIIIEAVVGILLALNIPPTLGQKTSTLLGAVFIVVGFGAVILSFIIRAALQNSPAYKTAAGKMRATTVTLVIAEAPAIIGLVHAALSGTLLFAAVLWVLALVACIVHFPRGDAFESR